jgi:hypothetical protein
MALKRLVIDGFGQLEMNQVAYRRDGRIEAQCALDATDFKDIPAENGMLLAVDKIAGTVKLPKAGNKLPIALNYTTEHMYDERTMGLKNFKTDLNSFYPRLGYLSVGDRFTTNCLAMDDAEFADEAALSAAYEAATAEAPLYGGICELGAIKVSKTKPTAGPVLMAVKGPGAGSMPDGQFAVKFVVVSE